MLFERPISDAEIREALSKAVSWVSGEAADSVALEELTPAIRQLICLSEQLDCRLTTLAWVVEMCLKKTPSACLVYDLKPPDDGDFLRLSDEVSRKLSDQRLAKIIHAFAAGEGKGKNMES